MRGVTPAAMAARLERFLTAALPEMLRGVLRYAATRWAGYSIGRYMRNARGEGRRRRTDRGPLRVLTGQTARMMRGRTSGGAGGGAQLRAGAIERIEVDGGRARLTKGGRGRGFFNERRTARSGVPLAFVEPGARDAVPDVEARLQRDTRRTLRAAIEGR